MKRSPLAALALMLALACAGCSDDDPEPRFGPPESTSPAPTETETTSEPPEPLDPEETVRAWVEARNVTIKDGSTDDVYALSTDRCETCRDLVEPVAAVYERGGHYETRGWQVEDAKQRPDFRRSREVATAIEYAAGRTYHDADAEPVAYEAEHHVLVFVLARESGAWMVDQIVYVS